MIMRELGTQKLPLDTYPNSESGTVKRLTGKHGSSHGIVGQPASQPAGPSDADLETATRTPNSLSMASFFFFVYSLFVHTASNSRHFFHVLQKSIYRFFSHSHGVPCIKQRASECGGLVGYPIPSLPSLPCLFLDFAFSAFQS